MLGTKNDPRNLVVRMQLVLNFYGVSKNGKSRWKFGFSAKFLPFLGHIFLEFCRCWSFFFEYYTILHSKLRSNMPYIFDLNGILSQYTFMCSKDIVFTLQVLYLTVGNSSLYGLYKTLAFVFFVTERELPRSVGSNFWKFLRNAILV